MTHIEQVAAAMADLIGRPFKPSRGQRVELRSGHTTEDVIACLPSQITDLRNDIAGQISEELGQPVPVDVIKPWMVAHLTVLDSVVKGFAVRDQWRKLRPDVLIQIGMALQDDVVAVMYRRFLGRWPEPEGRAHYEDQLAKGRTPWEIVREIGLSDEAQSR